MAISLFSVKQDFSFSKRILYSTSVYAPSLVQCTFSLPLIFSSNKFTCTLITMQIDPSWPKNPTASDNGTCKYIQFNKVVLFIMSNAPFYLSKFGLDWCTQKGVVEHAYDCSHFCHFLLPLISWQSRKVPVFTTAGQSPEPWQTIKVSVFTTAGQRHISKRLVGYLDNQERSRSSRLLVDSVHVNLFNLIMI